MTVYVCAECEWLPPHPANSGKVAITTNRIDHWAILFFRFQPSKQSDSAIPPRNRGSFEALLATVLLGATTVTIICGTAPPVCTVDCDKEQEDPASGLEHVSATMPANPFAAFTARSTVLLVPGASDMVV